MHDGLRIEVSDPEEFLEVREFVAGCPPLECYPEHVYKILLRYCGDSCVVARRQERIVGVVIGLFDQSRSGTYFLWQIGVNRTIRSRGLGARLLDAVEQQVVTRGASLIELTIDPFNTPSRRLFERNGYKNVSALEGRTVTAGGNRALADYYGPGRHFMLYRKTLQADPTRPVQA